MIVVGEVGLFYYLRQIYFFFLEFYLELFEVFIIYLKKWRKLLILYVVYEDVEIVCDLLEKYFVFKVYFYWFKGVK